MPSMSYRTGLSPGGVSPFHAVTPVPIRLGFEVFSGLSSSHIQSVSSAGCHTAAAAPARGRSRGRGLSGRAGRRGKEHHHRHRRHRRGPPATCSGGPGSPDDQQHIEAPIACLAFSHVGLSAVGELGNRFDPGDLSSHPNRVSFRVMQNLSCSLRPGPRVASCPSLLARRLFWWSIGSSRCMHRIFPSAGDGGQHLAGSPRAHERATEQVVRFGSATRRAGP